MTKINAMDKEHRLRHVEKCSQGRSYRRPTGWLGYFRVSAIMAGLEIAWTMESAFLGPLLLTLGVPMKFMSMFFCASPLLGLSLIPLVGILSEKHKSRFGRRRPFIFFLSLGLAAAVGFLPYGQDLGTKMFHDPKTRTLMGVALTMMASVVLDVMAGCLQIPTRNFLIDVVHPLDQNKGISALGLMAGVGGVIGGALGAYDWTTTILNNYFHGQIKIAFGIVFILIVFLSMVTLTSYTEIPTDVNSNPILDDESTEGDKRLRQAKLDKEQPRSSVDKTIFQNPLEGIPEIKADSLPMKASLPDLKNEINIRVKNTNHLQKAIEMIEEEEKNEHLNIPSEDHVRLSFKDHCISFIVMPNSLRMLFLTTLFGCMSYSCYAIFFSSFVGETIFKGSPDLNSTAHENYQIGLRYGSLGLSINFLSCTVYSFLIPYMIRMCGERTVFMGGQLIHTLGAIGMVLFKTKMSSILLSANIGIQYATFMSFPFLILTEYHESDKSFQSKRILGTDVAYLSCMLPLGQFILSSSLGFIVEFFGTTQVVMYACAILATLGFICSSFVKIPNLPN